MRRHQLPLATLLALATKCERFQLSSPGGGMADTTVLEAVTVRCAGSSPVPGTSLRQSSPSEARTKTVSPKLAERRRTRCLPKASTGQADSALRAKGRLAA